MANRTKKKSAPVATPVVTSGVTSGAPGAEAPEERLNIAHSPLHLQPTDTHIRRLLGGLPLSILAGIGLWLSLVWAAGPWAVLANTRILDILMKSGVIALTDADAGFIEGLPDHSYYLASQDPIKWPIVGIVVALFLFCWWLRSIQFHHAAQYHGIDMSFGQSVRALMHGSLYERFMPWGFGGAAAVAELEEAGAEPRRAHSVVFLLNAFLVFTIVVYALYAILSLGWASWFQGLFWAAIIFGLFYLWSRAPKAERKQQPSAWSALSFHIRELLRRPGRLITFSAFSFLIFGIEHIAAYLIAMAFTGNNVLLHVDFSLLLMALVAGYIARSVRFTPGGIGQFEWGFAAALYIGGIGLPEAATIAILDNVFRYGTLALLTILGRVWPSIRSSFSDVARVLGNGPVTDTRSDGNGVPALQTVQTGAHTSQLNAIPLVPAPYVPPPAVVWKRILLVGWLAWIYLFDRFTVLMADFWMLESLQLSPVFWTNLRMGAMLFLSAFAGFFLAVLIPAFLHRLTRSQRSNFAQAAIHVGLFAAMQLVTHTHSFLAMSGEPFGVVDPVFGRDISFYVFTLPNIETITLYALLAFTVLLISSVISAWVAARNTGDVVIDDVPSWLQAVGTPVTQIALVATGVASAILIWLSRYGLLYKDNSSSAIPSGADFLDVTGFFSTLNYINLTAVLVVADDIVLAAMLFVLYRTRTQRANQQRRGFAGLRQLAIVFVALFVIDLGFALGVYVRDLLVVMPNEPVVQIPYIQRHLDATRAAYGLEDIETIEFIPNDVDDPVPSSSALLDSPVIKNAPLWPPYSNYLEPVLDPQHAARVLQTSGDTMIYGPTLENFRQQQKLRTYYNFMSVDPLRFNIEGETQVFVSSVRELPLLDPQPWLTWWGQRFLLYTHGYGLVMAPISQVDADGGPVFVSDNIPIETTRPEFGVENPRVYFGEGSVTMAISNIRDLKEFDYPTAQGRAENILAETSTAGVAVDSLWKRIVFGWRSGQFTEMVFSGLLTPETRLEYYRPPIERLNRIAPFLYFDSNIYAVPTGDEIVWLVNGLTTTDRYPYSLRGPLGDKAVSRAQTAIQMRQVNYVEDSLKITVNAADGSVHFYQIASNPIVDTWAKIYPGLFTDATQDREIIPASVRQQLTYPLQLFHTQFDDIYNIYQMSEAVYFFNMEDMWDDGDEVLGPILDEGDAITFSIEPYNLLLETGDLLPASAHDTQFSMMAIFTPENAKNLRAIPVVYQDDEDYGRLSVLQIPKGSYVMGPEQADAAIDQDPYISQQIALWNRQGTEVVRGHTSLLLVDNEILYVEPLFIRSRQNPATQLKRVIVVFREKPYMADTLEAAIELAVSDGSSDTIAAVD